MCIKAVVLHYIKSKFMTYNKYLTRQEKQRGTRPELSKDETACKRGISQYLKRSSKTQFLCIKQENFPRDMEFDEVEFDLLVLSNFLLKKMKSLSPKPAAFFFNLIK